MGTSIDGVRERSKFPAGPTQFILDGETILTAHIARKKSAEESDIWVDKKPVRVTVVRDLMNGKFFVLLIPQKGDVDPKMIPAKIIGSYPIQQARVQLTNAPKKSAYQVEYKFQYKTFTTMVPESFVSRI